MLNDSHNNTKLSHRETSFQIKQDGKFFSKLLSRESSTASDNSSRYLYYGESPLSVPFMWESQPGTPKHAFSETSCRPLTPPPSISYSVRTTGSGCSEKRAAERNSSMSTMLTRLAPKKPQSSPSSSISSSSTSSSSWSASSSFYSSPTTSNYKSGLLGRHHQRSRSHHLRRLIFSCPRSSSHRYESDDDDGHEADEEDGYRSPVSTLKFGERRRSWRRLMGRNSMENMRTRFMSVLGHRRGNSAQN